MSDPFSTLGLTASASADEVREARRELARSTHPDAGGDVVAMQEINSAAAEALRIIAAPSNPPPTPTPTTTQEPDPGWLGARRDFPSFTVEALPAQAFEALLIAAAELGEIVDDDPPYELRTLLFDPLACWCQLDVVPDSGASTVSVSIATIEGRPLPPLIEVRNAWIVALNGLDWSTI